MTVPPMHLSTALGHLLIILILSPETELGMVRSNQQARPLMVIQQGTLPLDPGSGMACTYILSLLACLLGV